MNKNLFSKFIVLSVVLLNISFTIAILYIFLKTQNEPVTLISCWFGFTTGELWMLSSIKKKKVIKRDELKDKYIDKLRKNNGGDHYE